MGFRDRKGKAGDRGVPGWELRSGIIHKDIDHWLSRLCWKSISDNQNIKILYPRVAKSRSLWHWQCV